MKPLVILTGPTAVGKTQLSIGLAKAIGGEIISADSMQVYKQMDIGTAKIKPEEMDGVKHYLIDVLEPQEAFDVARFQSLCKGAMDEIYSKGKIPIIVGGTGFYIQSILYDIDFTESDAQEDLRQELAEYAKEKGNDALFEKLKEIDPKSALEIHPNNVKRVIRAIEYYHQTGQPISEHNEEQKIKKSPYKFRYYVLRLPREILYDRINKRVDVMKQEGLIDEVQGLLDLGCTSELVSMQGLGYKEIVQALKGDITVDEAFELIKKGTRHFAKRQFTWFRREREVHWIDKDHFKTEEELLAYCVKDLREQGII